ncbi:MAG: hypothetical protein ABMA14_01875 [Hyphomonadaceae bacterium]
MKRRSLPIWLLCDVPAFLGVMFSFWPLMILVIRSGFAAMRGEKVAKSIFDAIPILLAHAEARLDFALWREAYRRLGWSHRLVTFSAFAPPQDWPETEQRFEAYRRANMTLEATVRAYVEHLRTQYGIAKRDLVAHGSTDAALCAHPSKGFAAVREADELVRGTNSSGEARGAQRGHAHARGPPLNLNCAKPSRRRPRQRDRTLMPAAHLLALELVRALAVARS